MDVGTDATGRQRVTLTITCAATLIALMNYTAPMTVLPDVASGLGAGLSGQTWILNGIALGLAAVLLTAGSVADNHGRRRVFVAGATILAASSALCAAAWTTLVFVVGRLAQGAASAALIAAGLGLLAGVFTAPHARARATALWGSMLGAGITLGPVVSALFADAGSWRLFYVAIGLTAGVLAVAGRTRLRECRAQQARRVDLPGVITLTGGVGLLVAALTLGREGWLSPAVLGLAGTAFVVLALFVAVQWRGHDPMLDLALFRRAGFVAASVGALVSGLAVVGLMSYLPTVLQRAFVLTPLQTAGLFGVWSGTSFLFSLWTHRLMRRMRSHHELAFGMLLVAAGDIAMLGTVASGSWVRVVPGLVIAGVASGVLNAALARQAVDTVPADRSSMGSGANNTARYVGSSLGVALVVTIVSSAAPARMSEAQALASGTDLALVVVAAFAVLGAAVTFLLRDRAATSRKADAEAAQRRATHRWNARRTASTDDRAGRSA